MRSSLLLPTRTSRKIKGTAQMATTESSVQTLTFYEDLYLKQHKKSASIPNRRASAQPTSQKTKTTTRRQSSLSETQRKSWSQSPVNNPLLDSPPSARTLSLASKNKQADNQAKVDDTNNNSDYLRLCESARFLHNTSTAPSENIYENYRVACAAKKGSSTQSCDHVYEVIPAQLPNFYREAYYLADESNYLVPKTVATKNNPQSKTSKPSKQNSEGSDTNLRLMRRMGRSADSIRTVNDNRLRSQSTILAPQLWMKSPNVHPLANSASCDNLMSGQSLELAKLVSSDKENSSPYTCLSKPTNGHRENGTRVVKMSTSLPGSTERQSQRGGNGITTNSVKMRNTLRSSGIKANHRHSSSYAGTTSAYENMADIHRSLGSSRSEYVNVEEYLSSTADLNYADLDLTLPLPSKKVNTTSGKTASPGNTKKETASDDNDDTVEYTLINIAATEAARLASQQHQHDRQRRPPSGKSS